MRYTVLVRQIRTVEISADNREQLHQIMEQSFKAEPRCELEEWFVFGAGDEEGHTVMADLDMFWRRFPEPEESDT